MTRTMLSHVALDARDIDAARRFHDAALATLGLARIETIAGLASGCARGAEATPQFRMLRPPTAASPTRAPASPSPSILTFAFDTESRAQVDAFHNACLAQGGADAGAQGRRPHSHPNYHGAYARDRDRNRITRAHHRSPEQR